MSESIVSPEADRLETRAVRPGGSERVAEGAGRLREDDPRLSDLDRAYVRHDMLRREVAVLFGVPLWLINAADDRLSSRERLELIAVLGAIVPQVRRGREILQLWLERRPLR